MIKQAKRRGTTEKLSFCVADATALSYENENFDCVVISNALHIMPEPEKAMQEIRRVLKKDGILYAPTFLWAEKKSSGLRKRCLLQDLKHTKNGTRKIFVSLLRIMALQSSK